ncbi:protein MIZU-KUSSEI 1 [Morus notabilis]|uniref:protein MIZU-KUSSEI 1 n=1 Tax=Morus notabilis TaxID=981085 RepID=UPI000CED7A53|nr:protein MIZU-KUSSEI 1 [Morus notabilis]
MKTIMARTPHESSFSFSRRYFHWKKNDTNNDENDNNNNDEEEVEILTTFNSSSHHFSDDDKDLQNHLNFPVPQKNKKTTNKISKQLLSALSIFGHRKSHHHSRHHHRHLGTKVVGTLFGHRRGHVHFAFQEEAKLSPAFLIELAMPTSVLVREMASGLVRIALECEKKTTAIATEKMKPVKLIEEPVWRTYCNGKKCGFASRIECGPEEWKVLRAVGPISMGAGVLPGCDNGGGGFEGEIMYMRARFERVVGSKDSEAFYMMNPDGSGGPELSIYLLRV